MAFTTTTGSGGTSLIGTSGVDTVTLTTSPASRVFIGGQGANDIVNIAATAGAASGYSVAMGAGDDIFTAAVITSNSVIQGNDGSDTFNLLGVNLSTVSGLNGTDTINITGAITSSLINGNSAQDNITVGGAGIALTNSTIAGGASNDTIAVVAGTTLVGTRVNGQDGNDTITFSNTAANFATSTVFGGQGDDTITATNGGVVSTFSSFISGDVGDDFLTGGGANDTILGGDGIDVITGGGAADTQTGGGASDAFQDNANAGVTAGSTFDTAADVLAAGSTIISGAAAAGFDVITDFQAGAGGDTLNLATAGAFTLGYTGAGAGVTLGVGAGNVGAGANLVISGTYTAATGTFTAAASNTAGGDTLILTTNAAGQLLAGGGALVVTNGVVLTGVNASQIVAANIV